MGFLKDVHVVNGAFLINIDVGKMMYHQKRKLPNRKETIPGTSSLCLYIFIINVLGITSDNVTFSTHDATSGFGRS